MGGAGRPELRIVFVAVRRNVEDLPDVVRLAAKLGVRRMGVQNLSHSSATPIPRAAMARFARSPGARALWAGAGNAEQAFAEATSVGVELDLPRLEERPPRRRSGEPGCDWPWRATFVNHDGGVQPCCMVMGEDRASFGNALVKRFQAVWAGDRASAFRVALLSDDPPGGLQGAVRCTEAVF